MNATALVLLYSMYLLQFYPFHDTFYCTCQYLNTQIFFFPASRYVYFPRVPSSVQQSSATLSKYIPGTYFIVRVLSACVIYTLPHLGIILLLIRLVFFFVALISRVAFFCCALVPGTLALDLPTLNL